jgi:hypothetical protein
MRLWGNKMFKVNRYFTTILGVALIIMLSGIALPAQATELGIDQFECHKKGTRNPLDGKIPKPCDEIPEESKTQILAFCAQVHDWLVEKNYALGRIEYCSVGNFDYQIVFIDGPIWLINIALRGDKNGEIAGLSISLIYNEPDRVGAWPYIDCWDIKNKENIMVQTANHIRASYTQCSFYWQSEAE